ncbi:MAG: hypothetical protein U1E23_07465 [Reyranellaceae bacterium]
MTASSDRLLRRTLWANAAFSLGSGVVLVACAEPFARWAAAAPVSLAGLDLAIVFELLGVGVVAFGGLCAWIASRAVLPASWARLVFAADVLWVAGSVLAVASASWTPLGLAGIGVFALVVADLAVLEYLGLRRLGAASRA